MNMERFANSDGMKFISSIRQYNGEWHILRQPLELQQSFGRKRALFRNAIEQ